VVATAAAVWPVTPATDLLDVGAVVTVESVPLEPVAVAVPTAEAVVAPPDADAVPLELDETPPLMIWMLS